MYIIPDKRLGVVQVYCKSNLHFSIIPESTSTCMYLLNLFIAYHMIVFSIGLLLHLRVTKYAESANFMNI